MFDVDVLVDAGALYPMRALAALLFASIASGPADAAEDAWAALREPGTHVVMRHASAPGTGDPDDFRLGDCSTQRNLDDGGRAQARRIGDAIRAAGIAVDLVLTSQWCRARETADLIAVAPVEDEPALNSFFENRSDADQATEALRARLAGLSGRKAVLVTHQVNITALTGVFPASGEMVVIATDEAGAATVRGRIAIR